MKYGFVWRLIGLLFDPRVPRYKKQLFLFLPLAYWLAPDFLPFLPFDDLLFTLLSSWLFLQSAQRDVAGRGPTQRTQAGSAADFIDVTDYVVHEDNNNRGG